MTKLTTAVSEFLEASREDWGSPAAEKPYEQIWKLLEKAKPAELEAAADSLAAALADWPDPESGEIALMLGAFVEHGASPLARLGPLLERMEGATNAALEFARAFAE